MHLIECTHNDTETFMHPLHDPGIHLKSHFRKVLLLLLEDFNV